MGDKDPHDYDQERLDAQEEARVSDPKPERPDIEGLMELADHATPGPWEWSGGMLLDAMAHMNPGKGEVILWPENVIKTGGTDERLNDQQRWAAYLGSCGLHAEGHGGANAALLAKARTAVPALCRWVLSLEERCRTLERERGFADVQRARADRFEIDYFTEKKRAEAAEQERDAATRRVGELAGHIESIYCLVGEGPDVMSANKIIEAVFKECKEACSEAGGPTR